MVSERLAVDDDGRAPAAGSNREIEAARSAAATDLAGASTRRGVDRLVELAGAARTVSDEQFCRVVVELMDAVTDLGDLDRQQQAVALGTEAAARADGATPATQALVAAMTARISTARGDTEASMRAVSNALDLVATEPIDAGSRAVLALSLHRATNGVGDRAVARRCIEMGRQAAGATEDHRLEMMVEVAAALDALDDGDRPAVLRALARADELRPFVRSPVTLLAIRSVENALAILEGRYESARAGLEDLARLIDLAGVDSPVVWRQVAALALDTDDLAGFLPLILEQSDSFPQSATLHALAALAHLRAGDAIESRSIVDGFAASGYRHLGAGGPAPLTGAILAQTVHELGAVDLAAPLLTALAPFDERCVIDVTGSAIWLGSLDHHRGLLASLAGRHREAIALLDRGAAVHERMRARPWTVRSAVAAAIARERAVGASGSDNEAVELRRHAAALGAELGMVPPAEPTPANRLAVWRRHGDHWEVGTPDEPVHVAHRVGMTHLGRLLTQPDADVAAVDLDGNAASRTAPQSRVNVTKAIRAAISFVGEHDAALGEHLAMTVKTGALCRYTPPPDGMTWSVELG